MIIMWNYKRNYIIREMFEILDIIDYEINEEISKMHEFDKKLIFRKNRLIYRIGSVRAYLKDYLKLRDSL